MKPQGRKLGWTALVLVCCAIYPRPSMAQFLEPRAADAVLSNPRVVVPGDFNRDGKIDLAVAAFYEGKIAVLLGNGDGTFKQAAYYTVGGNETANSLVAVDLRNIGILDLVVTNSLNAEVEVLLGNGDGTFEQPLSYPTVAKPFYLAAGDFTNSSYSGVVALTYGAENCSCLMACRATGTGTLERLSSPIM